MQNFIFSGIFEINCSKDIKVQGIIGPCASLERVFYLLHGLFSLFSLLTFYFFLHVNRKVGYAPIRSLVKGIQLHGRCVALTIKHPYAFSLILQR